MRRKNSFDYLIFGLVVFLVAVGIVALASASSDLAKAQLNDADYYVQHQLIYGLGVGIIGFLLGLWIPYKTYKSLAPVLLALGIGFLLLTFTPLGFSAGGATRWIAIAGITIQPAEIMKVILVIYLAALFSAGGAKRQKSFWQGFVPFITISGIVSAVLFTQRSTSSVIITLAAAGAVYFVSGARKRYVFYLIALVLAAVVALVAVTPYRLERVKTYLSPDRDTAGASYQIDRALITIGSGGLWGVGFGNSISKKYLPERIGDSIFAIIAEEFGFVGATVLISAFLVLVTRGYLAAKRLRDPFGKLLLTGFSTLIGVQAFMHMGAISGIIPLTGVPLPFISYGGTALVVFMTMSGIMLNVIRKA